MRWKASIETLNGPEIETSMLGDDEYASDPVEMYEEYGKRKIMEIGRRGGD